MYARFFRASRLGSMLLLALLLVACGQAVPASQPQPATTTTLTPVLAVSELNLGANRLAFGVLKDGSPLNDPALQLGLRFFYLDGADKDTPQSESAAVYRGEGLPFGLYVGYATFAQPGAWRVEISVPGENGAPQTNSLRLDVLERPRTPPVGSPAVPSKNLTVRQEPDLSKITSDATPDGDLYQLTVAEAVAARTPFLVAFSTPGYCQTAVCAPNMAVIKQLKNEYEGHVNFLHVEVYPFPFGESFEAQRRVAAMDEWGLRTEPWTFLVDAQGVIQARYEGGITFSELKPALEQLAAGQAITPPGE